MPTFLDRETMKLVTVPGRKRTLADAKAHLEFLQREWGYSFGATPLEYVAWLKMAQREVARLAELSPR